MLSVLRSSKKNRRSGHPIASAGTRHALKCVFSFVFWYSLRVCVCSRLRAWFFPYVISDRCEAPTVRYPIEKSRKTLAHVIDRLFYLPSPSQCLSLCSQLLLGRYRNCDWWVCLVPVLPRCILNVSMYMYIV